MSKYTALTSIAVLMGLLLSGCTHDLHESISEEGSGTNMGYLATELTWEETSDAQNSITFVQLQHTDANGTVSVLDFDSPQEVASQYSTLPAGAYTLFAAINITEENGYRLSGIDTRADSAEDIRLSLINPSTPPAEQAWYGLSEITIEAGKLNVVNCLLQRAESSITVNINDVPTGTTASIDVQRVADYISLNVKDEDGRLGVPSETYSTVSLGSLSEEEGYTTTLSTSSHFLFPTAKGRTRSYLDIYLTTPSGNTLHSVADAPAMVMGRHYTVNISYKKISPYMYLDSYVINDWEEGWTVSGSVLNPDNNK